MTHTRIYVYICERTDVDADVYLLKREVKTKKSVNDITPGRREKDMKSRIHRTSATIQSS